MPGGESRAGELLPVGRDVSASSRSLLRADRRWQRAAVGGCVGVLLVPAQAVKIFAPLGLRGSLGGGSRPGRRRPAGGGCFVV